MNTFRRYRPLLTKFITSPLITWFLVVGLISLAIGSIIGVYKFTYYLVTNGYLDVLEMKHGTCNEDDRICRIRWSAIGYIGMVTGISFIAILVIMMITGLVYWTYQDLQNGKRFQNTVCGEFLITVFGAIFIVLLLAFGGWINYMTGISALVMRPSPISLGEEQIMVGSILLLIELLLLIPIVFGLWSFANAIQLTLVAMRNEYRAIREAKDK